MPVTAVTGLEVVAALVDARAAHDGVRWAHADVAAVRERVAQRIAEVKSALSEREQCLAGLASARSERDQRLTAALEAGATVDLLAMAIGETVEYTRDLSAVKRHLSEPRGVGG